MSGADDRDQVVANLEARLAVVEVERDDARNALSDAQNAALAATQERDAAIASAEARVADADGLRRAAEDERDAYRRRAEDRDTLAARVVELEAARVDSLIADAKNAGKLRTVRDPNGEIAASAIESRLRKVAARDGIAALEAELAEMPVIVPVRRLELRDEDPNPRPSTGPIPREVLADVANQMGLTVEELEDNHHALAARRRS